MAEAQNKHEEEEDGDDLFHAKDDEPEVVDIGSGRLMDPILASEKEDVQEIIYMRKENGFQEFLIRWRGHHEFKSTWEKEEDLKPWQNLIDNFVSEEVKEDGKSKPPTDPLKRGRGRPKVANPKKKRRTEVETKEEENTEEWSVRRLVLMRKRNNKREFLVEWEGYPPEQSTWEFEEMLSCHDLISELLKK